MGGPWGAISCQVFLECTLSYVTQVRLLAAGLSASWLTAVRSYSCPVSTRQFETNRAVILAALILHCGSKEATPAARTTETTIAAEDTTPASGGLVPLLQWWHSRQPALAGEMSPQLWQALGNSRWSCPSWFKTREGAVIQQKVVITAHEIWLVALEALHSLPRPLLAT
jgi:hypothetical protein